MADLAIDADLLAKCEIKIFAATGEIEPIDSNSEHKLGRGIGIGLDCELVGCLLSESILPNNGGLIEGANYRTRKHCDEEYDDEEGTESTS